MKTQFKVLSCVINIIRASRSLISSLDPAHESSPFEKPLKSTFSISQKPINNANIRLFRRNRFSF